MPEYVEPVWASPGLEEVGSTDASARTLRDTVLFSS